MDGQREFPGQIERVLHPRVHALATGWAMNMRGVAAKESPPRAIACAFARIDSEPRQPDRIEQLYALRSPLLDDRRDLFKRRIARVVPAAWRDIGDDAAGAIGKIGSTPSRAQ
jgi:hypothetical protein